MTTVTRQDRGRCGESAQQRKIDRDDISRFILLLTLSSTAVEGTVVRPGIDRPDLDYETRPGDRLCKRFPSEALGRLHHY